MALSKNTERYAFLTATLSPAPLPIGVLTNVHIYVGALVCTTAAGFLRNGITGTNLIAQGIAVEEIDTTGISSGTRTLGFKTGDFEFTNSAGAACTIAHIGLDVYIEDDDVVANSDGGGTRSRLGKMVGLNGTRPVVRVGVGN